MTTPPKTKFVKPPKEDWPTFILDLGAKPGEKWTIRRFEECEKDFWDDSIGWKYSAISYAWGFWHDKGDAGAKPPRTVQWHDSTKEPDYPAFDTKVTPTWSFPVLNKNYTAPGKFKDPIDPIFTVQEVHKALSALGTRFVWWDWACVPQGPETDLKAKALPNPGSPPNPQNLYDIQALEVDKMRIVYPSSLNGCLWLHQSTWMRDNKAGIKGPVQLLLEHIVNMRTAGFAKLTLDAVEAFYGLLLATQNTQGSLTSVWSFQEGVLFGDSNRPQVGPTKEFRSGSSTCLILDHNGQPFGDGSTDFLVGGLGDYVLDIVVTATTIFGIVTNVLGLKATSKPLPSGASPFESLCYIEDTRARDLLSRLIATGFIGYLNNNPMTLLESKFTRTLKSPWSAEADRTVRAVIGSMNVDIPKPTLLKAAEEKAKAASAGGWKAGDMAECTILKPAFLQALVQGYQWRLLLHARSKQSLPAAGAPPTKSWWVEFAELKRPPFAALEYYIGPTKLFNLYQPRQARPTTLPADVYDLPTLEVAAKPEQPLVVKQKTAYKYYDLSKYDLSNPATKAVWTDCHFFDYVRATPADLPENLVDAPGFPHQPGTVSLNVIASKDGAIALGTKIVLLPFEKDEPTLVNPALLPVPAKAPSGLLVSALGAIAVESSRYVRCFVLTDFDAAKRTANFRGVGDFQGLNDGDSVALDKDLEIW